MREDLESQLRAVFREEANEIFDEFRIVVGRLRVAEGREAQAEIDVAMRLAHNLKGAAGSVGLELIAETAHALEDALLALRDAPVARLRAAVPLFGDAVTALEDVASGKDESHARSVRARLDAMRVSIAPPAPDTEVRRASLAPKAASIPPESQAEPEPVLTDSGSIVLPGSDAAKQAGATVRIEAARLDRLFDFVSELLVTETGMRRRHETCVALRESLGSLLRELPEEQRGRAAMAIQSVDSLVEEHHRAIGEFSRLSHDLHSAMRRARMVPLASLSATFRRTVADAARLVGKRVDVDLALAGIELDKVVLDRLRDPLVHLLRNAVDHGIEAADVRDRLGKPETGLVELAAEVVGSTVRIRISDDGSGIDVAKVRSIAIAKGLEGAASVPEHDTDAIVDLLFVQGFSTRSKATMLSGRGVGLDVVRRSVAEIGGTVTVEPRGPLGGSSFELMVPLSVLSTRMLLVRAADALYMIPVHAVDRVARVPKSAIRTLDGRPVIASEGGEPRAVHFLAHLFGGRVAQEAEVLRVLMMSHGTTSIAVAVDDILLEEDFVVRKLPWNLFAVPGVSGAVSLPDGAVAIAVDVRHLFTGRVAIAQAAPESRGGRGRVLVVDDSMTTRILHRNILVAARYEVVMANDGSDAWDRLRREAFDAVVSDVQMPGIDGFELTRRIRSDARLGRVPVVLVTSLARADDVQRGLDAGADEYVVKGPLENDALLAAVERHVG